MALSLLSTALLQPLEFALNRLLARDPHIIDVMAAAGAGKTITVICSSLPRWQLSVLINPDRILLLSAPQDAPDACLTGSHRALTQLLLSDDQASALHHPDIELSGDVQLIQRLHRALNQLDIDWQDLAGPLLGDIGANIATTGWQHSRDAVAQAGRALQQNITDFVQEEAALSPTREEVEHSREQLDALRLRLDRLQARIQGLQQLVTN